MKSLTAHFIINKLIFNKMLLTDFLEQVHLDWLLRFYKTFSKRSHSPGSEPGIFLIFGYFLSQLQHLKPLGNCTPLCALELYGFLFLWRNLLSYSFSLDIRKNYHLNKANLIFLGIKNLVQHSFIFPLFRKKWTT